MLIDAYHSGDERLPAAPFLFVKVGDKSLPKHPSPRERQWTYWKRAPLSTLAVTPTAARRKIEEIGFFVQ